MKFNGKPIPKILHEIVVIPRKSGDMVYRAAPVTDFSDFNKLCPQPQPPKIMRKGGITVEDVEDKEYKAAIMAWAGYRTDWLIIKSLQATPELEWETVNLSDSSTWVNFRKEFEDSGLTAVEVGMIIQCVVDACGLNQKKIDEATKAFLAGQAETPSAQ